MIIGVYGYQDSGKTKLVERLVRALHKKGYSVASVKHSPHRKSLDCEGKDTWRHWQAGSDPVVFSSEAETTVFKHSKVSIDEIVRMLELCFSPDVIVVEGLKNGNFPKVSVGRIAPTKGTVLENPSLVQLTRYVEAEIRFERVLRSLPGLNCGKCGTDCVRLAKAVAAGKRKLNDCKELADTEVEITVGGERLALGRFASTAVDGTVRGLLGSLKGYRPGADVEIRLNSRSTAPKKRASR